MVYIAIAHVPGNIMIIFSCPSLTQSDLFLFIFLFIENKKFILYGERKYSRKQKSIVDFIL